MFLFNILVCSILPLVVLSILIYTYKCQTRHRNQPPSPWKLPVIGNFHQLALGNHRSFWKLAKTHGPLMLMHIGSAPVLVASSVHAAREIMKTRELMFLGRLESSITDKITYNGKDVTFSRYGEYWKYAKSFVVNHLLSNKKVVSFQHVREEETTFMIKIIEKSCGLTVNFSELLFSHTNNVFSRVVFGRTIELQIVKDLIEQSVELISLIRVGDYIPCLSWIDKLKDLDGTIENHTKQFDQLLDQLIHDHLHRKINDDIDQCQCFIDAILQEKEDNTHGLYFQKDDIKAILVDIFVAGTLNPFASLEWALSELVKNPRTMIKLQQEVKEIAQGRPKVTKDDLGKLQYMNAVLKESLRLHPPVALIARNVTQAGKLMGYDIEARTNVFINIWAIGRDPTVWEEPEEFRPERFLGSPINYQGSDFELIPFGTGRRRCPGIQYTKSINELALANLVYKFDLALPDGRNGVNLDMMEGNGIFVHRKNHLLLVATHSK